MGLVKTKGIVIRELVVNDYDKILTVLTAEQGKISVMAKGAKRSRSGISAGATLLCYSMFTMFRGKKMYIVNDIDIMDTFYDLRMQMEAFAVASYFAEVLQDVVPEEQPANEALRLLLNCLHFLRNGDKSPMLLKMVFELRLMLIAGFAPMVSCCALCGDVVEESSCFSFPECGLLCRACTVNKAYPPHEIIYIQKGSVAALRHIVEADFDRLFSFQLSGTVLKEVQKIAEQYLLAQTEKKYKTLLFLREFPFS